MSTFSATGHKIPLTGSNTWILPCPSKDFVGSIAIQIVAGTLATLSLTVQARSNAGEASTDGVAFEPIPYLAQYLNGAVGTNVYSSVAITGNSIIQVPATGLEIALVFTSASGTGAAYWYPLAGASA